MVTIGDFILARVEDDAFLATHMIHGRNPDEPTTAPRPTDAGALGWWDPSRVLAVCEVRRLLVANHRVGRADATPCPCGGAGSARPPCHTLRAVALEWADHPDYRAEWRGHPVPPQPVRTR